jgi:hypothetical protein
MRRGVRAPSFDDPCRVPGRWWKVGFHAHTVNSDGRLKPEEMAAEYARHGCDAMVISDHDYVTRLEARRGWPLPIPAVEVMGRPDVICLPARGEGRISWGGRGLQETIDRIRRRGGMAIVAHPSWSGLSGEKLKKVSGFAALEIYNHARTILNGRTHSTQVWDELLETGARVWGVAGDDAHDARLVAKAFLRVKSPSLTVNGILAALRRGAFYSSQGPRIHGIRTGGGRIRIRTSPAMRVYFISGGEGGGWGRFAPGGKPRTRWSFDIIREELNVEKFARFEVVDARGRVAWSNPLFVRGRGIRFWGLSAG